ncbi:MAG: RDD family protein, partial [Deltaproteobacteria bacterium]|nr:RDD family protein [Deltaproteobacteria bacterium]
MVALLVDSFALGVLQLGSGLLFTAVLQRLDEIFSRNLNASGTALIGFLFSLVIGFAYPVFFTGYCGQTPGKMA